MASKSTAQIADELHIMREEIRDLEKIVKKKKAEFDAVAEKALARMEKEGASKITGELATVSISVNNVPNVSNWDKFYAFIKRNNSFHLLERRPAAKPCREELEARRNRAIPGVEWFEKRSLNLRNL